MYTQIKYNIYKYYLFNLLRNVTFFTGVLVPFFTDWGNISLVQVRILQSWFMFWIFILEVPTGAVADFIGRKYSLALGSLIATIGVLIYGSIPRFEIFLIGEFMLAFATALDSGADQALMYDSLIEIGKEDKSSLIFGKSHSLKMIGILIAAPIGAIIGASYGLNYPTLLCAVPFLISFFVALSFYEPKRLNNNSESTRYIDIIRKGLMFFYKHAILRKMALDAVIVASSAYYVIWFYQPLLKSIGMDIYYFGFMHSFLVIIEILVSANFSRFEKLFGSSNRFLLFSAYPTGLTFIITAFFTNIFTITLLIMFAGGFGLTRIELIFAHMQKYIPSSERATIISSISMFRRFILFLLNPVMGVIATNSIRYAALTAGILPFIAITFTYLFYAKSTTKHRELR